MSTLSHVKYQKMGKYIFLKCTHKSDAQGSVETENNGLAEFWNLTFTQLYRNIFLKNNFFISYKRRMHNQGLDA
jgi:hypothetical protein